MIKRMQQDAVLLSLINEMKAEGSWCGETHNQKATYFLRELLGVPMNFEFILYEHGDYKATVVSFARCPQAPQGRDRRLAGLPPAVLERPRRGEL